MEDEIDQLFLNSQESTTNNSKISNLKICADAIPTIYPYIDLIISEILEIKTDFSVYGIQLNTLAEDLRSIQKYNNLLEDKIDHELAVYSALKQICIDLSLDDNYFRILDNGSFTNIEDLVEMEKSLSILADFKINQYTIRIIQEKSEEIIQSIRNFLKRFITYLSKLFIKSDSTGELKVHRSLYKSMSRYKFIYIYSKCFDDYYSVLCDAYIMHAKKIYEVEFNNHLESIHNLIDTKDKLRVSIDVLLKSYLSLVGCEINFLKIMEIKTEPDEIFRNINSMIIEFIGEMFQKSKLTTILYVNNFCSIFEADNSIFMKFKKDLDDKYKVFEELFLRNEREKHVNFERIDNLNLLPTDGGNQVLRDRLVSIYTDNILKGSEGIPLQKHISRLQLLYSIDSTGSIKKDALQKLNGQLSKKVVNYTFENGDEVKNVESMIDMIDVRRGGVDEILREIRLIVVENMSDVNGEKILRIFESGLNPERQQ